MRRLNGLIFAVAAGCLAASPLLAAERPPNILVILADDLGYSDVGFQGCKDIPTPQLDALAAAGIRCTSGYVSHSFCSPTRAGLLTGRYQQRFGHENNPAWLPDDPKIGLPLSQHTLPEALKAAGYATGCVGKWHLGAHPSFHPNRRGFDEYYGMLGGGHVYFPELKGGVEYTIPMNRNGRPEPLRGYLTEELGREAAAFVERRQGSPWFLYLAFNAPHTPLQATDALAARVAGIADETRRKYAALVVGMDDAVGQVRQALANSGQEENTLVFFFSDNGGPTDVAHTDNAPLRGQKGALWEGGIRVPFVISWPAQLAKGAVFDQPVSSLDVFATAIALANAKPPAGQPLDGVDLMPALLDPKQPLPRERMFWRMGGGQSLAVRQGKYKLLQQQSGRVERLFDLEADISEQTDLAAKLPEVASRLRSALAAWNAELIPPLFESPPNAPAKKPQPAKPVTPPANRPSS